MKKIVVDTKMPVRRSIEAIALQEHRSVYFGHKNKERGGAKNTKEFYLRDSFKEGDDEYQTPEEKAFQQEQHNLDKMNDEALQD